MELLIAGDLHDWVKATPDGVAKPAIWMTLYTHKWGDKALGASRAQHAQQQRTMASSCVTCVAREGRAVRR
jgi:hypothetical protein